METETQDLPSPRSDLVSGGVWMVIGIAIAIGSWNMDRLAKQGVPAFAAPGLVPGILGVLIALTALAIVLRSLQRGALRPEGRGTAGRWNAPRRGPRTGIARLQQGAPRRSGSGG